MGISIYSSQQQNNTDNTWNRKDNILLGLSISLLVAEIILIGVFVYKIFIKKSHQIFGNKKTTQMLDKVFLFTLFLLVLQAVLGSSMVLISKKVKNGLICSIFNFVFNTFNIDNTSFALSKCSNGGK